MKILVTGGAGFIGSHVADGYVREGHQVVVLDSLVHGRRENVPREAEFVEADIRSPEAARLLEAGGFDVLNHHAAQMDVRVSVQRPEFDLDVNLAGTVNLLEAARKGGVSRVLFVSSGGVVYGEPEVRPPPEAAPKAPASPYGVTKLTGEYYLAYYRQVHGLEYVALRYSNVYGPRQDPHGEAGVVAIFSTRLLEGEPLTVFGDGAQTRDYVFVEDVVRANLLLTGLDLPPAHSIDDRAFNVGTGEETSVRELARLLARAAGREVPVEEAPARPGELRASSLDASKLGALGWEPHTPLALGLGRTYRWIAAQHAGKPAVA